MALFLPFLLLLLLTPAISDDLTGELHSLQSRSPSGVIHLTDALISRILTPTPRPFTLVVFFDASHLRNKPDLHLPQLRSEFALVSSSHSLNNPNSNTIFFCDIDFAESQHSFSLFQVSSLPHVRLIPPSGSASPKESFSMDASAFSRLAESMAEFVEAKSGIEIGSIRRPPPISPFQIGILIVLFLIASPFIIRKVIKGETLAHDPRIWMFGAVFIYFFSVSGTMHNIIRKMPMFVTDRNDPNKLVFFYQGSGMQLGAEGFTVGFLYTVVGLLIAFVSHVLVRVKSVAAQRGFMIAVMVVSVWAVRKVIYLDNWKTGYSVHAYWPSGWYSGRDPTLNSLKHLIIVISTRPLLVSQSVHCIAPLLPLDPLHISQHPPPREIPRESVHHKCIRVEPS